MIALLGELVVDENGATMVEYGIIAAFLALPSLAILATIANTCGTSLTATGTGLTSIATTNP